MADIVCEQSLLLMLWDCFHKDLQASLRHNIMTNSSMEVEVLPRSS